jgi:hypothetical protein
LLKLKVLWVFEGSFFFVKRVLSEGEKKRQHKPEVRTRLEVFNESRLAYDLELLSAFCLDLFSPSVERGWSWITSPLNST